MSRREEHPPEWCESELGDRKEVVGVKSLEDGPSCEVVVKGNAGRPVEIDWDGLREKRERQQK